MRKRHKAFFFETPIRQQAHLIARKVNSLKKGWRAAADILYSSFLRPVKAARFAADDVVVIGAIKGRLGMQQKHKLRAQVG